MCSFAQYHPVILCFEQYHNSVENTTTKMWVIGLTSSSTASYFELCFNSSILSDTLFFLINCLFFSATPAITSHFIKIICHIMVRPSVGPDDLLSPGTAKQLMVLQEFHSLPVCLTPLPDTIKISSSIY
jgi:hypothetical protein